MTKLRKTVGGSELVAKVAKLDTDLNPIKMSNKLDKTGDGRGVTITYTAQSSGDPANISSGSTLAQIFAKIQYWFTKLGSLAWKSSVSNSDISGTISDSHVASASTWNGKYAKPSSGIPKTDLASGVQTSLGKADSALQNHQSVVDSNPTLSWGTQSKVGSVGSTDLHVTMPSNPTSNKLNVDGSNGTAAGVSTLINKLSEGTSNPQDTDFYVSQYAGGGTTTTTYHRRPMSALWAYIKSKISNDLGLNSSTYGGTSTRSDRSVNWGAQADPTKDIYMTAQIEPSSYAAGVVVPFNLDNKTYFGALTGNFAINYLVSILEATFQKRNGILLQVNTHAPSNPPITDNNWHFVGMGPEVTNGGKVALDIGINNSGGTDAIITFQVMSQSSGGTVESTQSVYVPKTNTSTAVMGIVNNLVAHHPYLFYKVASGSWDGGMTARWTVYN